MVKAYPAIIHCDLKIKNARPATYRQLKISSVCNGYSDFKSKNASPRQLKRNKSLRYATNTNQIKQG